MVAPTPILLQESASYKAGQDAANIELQRQVGLLRAENKLPTFAAYVGMKDTIVDETINAFATSGFSVPGDGGDAYYRRVLAPTSGYGKANVQTRDGSWWELIYSTAVRPEMFGAIGNGVFDNYLAIQNANDYLFAKGGGNLNFLSAHYMLSHWVYSYPNVSWSGAGRGVSVVERIAGKTLGEDESAIYRFGYDGKPQGGQVSVRDMTFVGTGKTYPYQGGGEQLVNITQADAVYIDNVEFRDARLFSLHADAKNQVNVTNCYVHDGFRDGLNLGVHGPTGVVYVAGNVIERIGDDGIVVNIGNNAYTGVYMPSVRIIGNRLVCANGIKTMPGRNVTVMGNHIERYNGYGIYTGLDANYNEGWGTQFAINISNNTLLNGLSNDLIGSGAVINSAILIQNVAQKGSGGTAITTYERYRDNAAGRIVTSGKYLLMSGPQYPQGAAQGITVSNNIIKQTLDYYVDHFSDYGLGKLWFVNGEIDPACPGLIRRINGIRLDGDFDGITISHNQINGVGRGIFMRTSPNFRRNVFIHGNRIMRVGDGVTFANDSGATPVNHGLVDISNNHFDIDPFLELDRNSDGSWQNSDGSEGFGVNNAGQRGVVAQDNVFESCRVPMKFYDSGWITGLRNKFIWDWSNLDANTGIGTNKGIALVALDADNFWNGLHIFRYCDPTQPNYLEYSSPVDGALTQGANSLPDSGWYVPGTFVTDGEISYVNGANRTGWRRVTWGNRHTLGVDWMPIYEYNSPKAPPA